MRGPLVAVALALGVFGLAGSVAQDAAKPSSGARTGAVCADGWRSSATGQGACSHHGGVARWTYKQIPGSTPPDWSKLNGVSFAGAALVGLAAYGATTKRSKSGGAAPATQARGTSPTPASVIMPPTRPAATPARQDY